MLRGLVRPLTRMYSGTSRPASVSSSPSHTSYVMGRTKLAVGLGGARLGAQILADAGHQATHLVGHRAHVDGLFAQDGQARVLAGRRDEQGLVEVFDDDLLHRPAVEAPTRSRGDAVHR